MEQHGEAMNQLPACPLCLGKLTHHTHNTNNDLLFNVTGAIGVSVGAHSVDARCENGCNIFVQASKPGNPSEWRAVDGSVPVEFRALRSGALKAGW